MVANNFDPALDAASDEDEEAGLDLEGVRELVGFAMRAPRRHPRLAAGLLAVGLLATFGTVTFIPRTFTSDAKLLAQRNLVLPALGNPNRAIPNEADNLTRTVADVVMQRDNLVSLVKQVDLIDRWDTGRSVLLHAKDAFFKALYGAPSEEDRMRGLLATVEKKLSVVADDTSVTITADWSDPEMAYELASTVQKNFLDAKYDADVGMITDAIAILEKHLATENDNIGAALADLRAAEGLSKSASPAGGSPATTARATSGSRHASVAASRKAAPDSGDLELASQLEDKRAQIKKAEAEHDQLVADLNRRLSDALGTLTPAHPTVLALKSQLEDASKDPPELTALKNDEKALVAQIAVAPTPAATARPRSESDSSASGTTAPAAAAPARAPSREPEDPGVEVARNKLQAASQNRTSLEARINSAGIELDVARAAFKYRFSVVHPAEFPRGPRKPNVPLVLIGGILGSFLLAIGSAVLADLAGGGFVELWQVRRSLKLPILGEIEPP
jgi:uncharacterized protein involved in exopolysaccharide biosynthesis